MYRRRAWRFGAGGGASNSYSFAHDLVRKPVPTFRDHSLEVDDDFAEHLPAFQPCQAGFKIRQRKLAVDDRGHAGRDLGQAVADVADRGAERAENLVLLLEQLHQVDGDIRPGGRAAGYQPAAALEAEQRGIEAFAADMLEHHVDAFLGGELAHDALETLGLVVDDMVGPE